MARVTQQTEAGQFQKQLSRWGVMRSAICRAAGVRRHALPYVVDGEGVTRRLGRRSRPPRKGAFGHE